MKKINRRQFGLGLCSVAGAIALKRFPLQPQLRINDSRLMEHLRDLAEFGKNPQGGVSRCLLR